MKPALPPSIRDMTAWVDALDPPASPTLKASDTMRDYERFRKVFGESPMIAATEEEDTTMPTKAPTPIKKLGTNDVWALIEKAAPVVRRVLLYGPPGTGKSYLARTANVKDASRVYPLVVHADLPAAELRGHFIPQETGGLRWADGPATMAWRSGGRLVLDEIDKAGDDALSFLLGVLDDEKTARMTLGTTGETITPHPDFTVWATMNGEPDDLPPALQDRFTVAVRINAPHPAAVKSLPQDLQKPAISLCAHADPSRRVGLRAFMEFATLRDTLGRDSAAFLVFGDRWKDVSQALALAGASDPS